MAYLYGCKAKPREIRGNHGAEWCMSLTAPPTLTDSKETRHDRSICNNGLYHVNLRRGIRDIVSAVVNSNKEKEGEKEGMNEYAEASKRFRALARTAELVAHRMVTEHDRNTAVTLSVLAALGLEECAKMDKALNRMIENGSANRQAKRNPPIARGMGELNEY